MSGNIPEILNTLFTTLEDDEQKKQFAIALLKLAPAERQIILNQQYIVDANSTQEIKVFLDKASVLKTIDGEVYKIKFFRQEPYKDAYIQTNLDLELINQTKDIISEKFSKFSLDDHKKQFIIQLLCLDKLEREKIIYVQWEHNQKNIEDMLDFILDKKNENLQAHPNYSMILDEILNIKNIRTFHTTNYSNLTDIEQAYFIAGFLALDPPRRKKILQAQFGFNPQTIDLIQTHLAQQNTHSNTIQALADIETITDASSLTPEKLDKIPEQYQDVFSDTVNFEPMTTPVISPQGTTYNKDTLKFNDKNIFCDPLTGVELTPDQLIPNNLYIKLVNFFSSANNSNNLTPDILVFLKCPLTKELFKDPVVAQDGETYERTALITYLQNNNNTTPKGAVQTLTVQGTNYRNEFAVVLQDTLLNPQKTKSETPKSLEDLLKNSFTSQASMKDPIVTPSGHSDSKKSLLRRTKTGHFPAENTPKNKDPKNWVINNFYLTLEKLYKNYQKTKDVAPLINILRCPLTGKIFETPVVAADGKTYEHTALVQFLMENNNKTPTGKKQIFALTDNEGNPTYINKIALGLKAFLSDQLDPCLSQQQQEVQTSVTKASEYRSNREGKGLRTGTLSRVFHVGYTEKDKIEAVDALIKIATGKSDDKTNPYSFFKNKKYIGPLTQGKAKAENAELLKFVETHFKPSTLKK